MADSYFQRIYTSEQSIEEVRYRYGRMRHPLTADIGSPILLGWCVCLFFLHRGSSRCQNVYGSGLVAKSVVESGIGSNWQRDWVGTSFNCLCGPVVEPYFLTIRDLRFCSGEVCLWFRRELAAWKRRRF